MIYKPVLYGISMSKKFGFDRVAGKVGKRGWKKSKSNKIRNREEKLSSKTFKN